MLDESHLRFALLCASCFQLMGLLLIEVIVKKFKLVWLFASDYVLLV